MSGNGSAYVVDSSSSQEGAASGTAAPFAPPAPPAQAWEDGAEEGGGTKGTGPSRLEAAEYMGAESQADIEALPPSIYKDVIKEAWRRIEEDTRVRDSWSKLGAFLLFFITYLLVLYLQLTPSSVFEVETSIREAVFSPNSGMVDESGRVVARVSDAEDIYSLLEKSLLPMYTHVTCGDGKCDDGEKPWYAGDGCASVTAVSSKT